VLTLLATVALVAAVFIGSSIGGQQSGWLAATEKRLEATKTLLSSLKAVKMMSSGQRVKLAIEKLRLLEFGASRFYRILIVGTVLCCKNTVHSFVVALVNILTTNSIHSHDPGSRGRIWSIHRIFWQHEPAKPKHL